MALQTISQCGKPNMDRYFAGNILNIFFSLSRELTLDRMTCWSFMREYNSFRFRRRYEVFLVLPQEPSLKPQTTHQTDFSKLKYFFKQTNTAFHHRYNDRYFSCTNS